MPQVAPIRRFVPLTPLANENRVPPELSRLHATREAVFPDAPRAIGDLMEQRLSDYLYVSTYLGYERQSVFLAKDAEVAVSEAIDPVID